MPRPFGWRVISQRLYSSQGNAQELQKAANDVNVAGAEALVYALDLREPHAAEVVVKGTLDRKPGFAAVAATNAAITALAKAFAEQGIKDGIQVNSVVPGAVMTGPGNPSLKSGHPHTPLPWTMQ
jgi:NAD(P)-dependent dehydrogenase (short-subunit alcohol dehydrogenase family)